MNIAEMLVAWRKYNRLTETEAARRIGMGRDALRKLERGQPVSGTNLSALICWLFSWS